MVAPHENVANAAIPINLIVIVPYFVGVSAAGGGDSTLLQAFSIFPPMVSRCRVLVLHALEAQEASKRRKRVEAIYRGQGDYGDLLRVTMRGGKVKWRDAWRATQGERTAVSSRAA